jgi:regulatory protein
LNDFQNKARIYALKLLSYRGRSEQELQERLKRKGFSEATVAAVVHNLKLAGIVDDANLAEALKWEAFTVKLLSNEGAKRYMLERGRPRGIVESALKYDEEREWEQARRLIDKKLRSLRNHPAAAARRRIYSFLARKGYSSGLIAKLFREHNLYKEEET